MYVQLEITYVFSQHTCLVAGLNLKILLWLKSGLAVNEILSVSLSFSSRYTLYLHCTSCQSMI
jgi:hypothetical protein